MAENKLKQLGSQGKALIAPLDNEAEAFKQKQDNIDAYTAANSQQPAGLPTIVVDKNSLVNPTAQYGSKPGEQRIDVSSMLKPLPSYDKGTPYVPEDEVAQLHEGEAVVPAEENPNTQEGAPADFGGTVLPNPDHIKVQDSDKPIDESTKLTGGAKMQTENGKPAHMDVSNPPKNQMEPATDMKDVSTSTMKPLGGVESPAPKAAPKPEPTPEEQLAKQIQVNKDSALKEGGIKGMTQLGLALIQEKELHKSAPMQAVMHAAAAPPLGAAPAEDAPVAPDANAVAPPSGTPDVGLGKAAPEPKYTGPLAYGQKEPAQGEPIPAKNLQTDVDLAAVPKTPEELKAKEQELKATVLNAEAQGDQVRAGSAKAALAELAKQNPYGSATNHPGTLGKIEHGLAKVGNIAGDVLAPGATSLIPGSELNNEEKAKGAENEIAAGERGNLEKAQTDAQKEIAGAAARDTKLQGTLLAKGWVLSKDAQGNPVVTKLPGYDDAPKDMPQQLAKAVNDYAASFKGDPKDFNPSSDPKVKGIMDVITGTQPEKGPNAQADVAAKEAIIGKLDKAGLPTDPEHINESLDKGLQNNVITADEHAAVKGFQGVKGTDPGTKVIVSGNEAQDKAKLKNAGADFTYTDDEGTHLVKGDKLPDGVDATPIKNVEQFLGEARAGNTVQQSLNRLEQDAEEHPELWDNAEARNILATATEDIQRASAGILIAGTGGSIPIPAGLGHMIDTALENKVLDKKTGDAVKQYIADYKAMKDKALVMQMELQGGKIGRAGAQGFLSITQQIPDGSTPDSKTAQRQLANLQQTQNELFGKYPDKHGDFVKEKPYGSDKNKTGGYDIDASQIKTLKSGEKVYPRNGQWYDVLTNKPLPPKQ